MEKEEASRWEGRKLPSEKKGSFPVEKEEASRQEGRSVTVESYEAFQWKASR